MVARYLNGPPKSKQSHLIWLRDELETYIVMKAFAHNLSKLFGVKALFLGQNVDFEL